MAIRKIVTIGAPRENVLHAKAKKVSRFDPYLQRLVRDLWDTMYEAPGVGLAAPQIGESIRVLVAEYEDNSAALINPEIIETDGEELGSEACLSIPGLVGDNVPRATRIVVKARDPHGKPIKLHAEGWWARILQHEIDHLDGVLYTDRVSPEFVREALPGEVVDDPAELTEPAGGGVARIKKAARQPLDMPTSAPASSQPTAHDDHDGHDGHAAASTTSAQAPTAASLGQQPKNEIAAETAKAPASSQTAATEGEQA